MALPPETTIGPLGSVYETCSCCPSQFEIPLGDPYWVTPKGWLQLYEANGQGTDMHLCHVCPGCAPKVKTAALL